MKLPKPFVTRTRQLLKAEYPAFEEALQREAPTSVRLNPKKAPGTLSGNERVPWSAQGFYLNERPAFTFDPLFHAGAYYVQEASSMFLGQVIRQYVTRPVRCLDLCAAPGGKTTDAVSELPEGSLMVSNEIVRNRAYILAENVIKWGSPYCIVTNNGAEDFGILTGYFDVILTDVPCSGEGMFRKDPESIGEWSVENAARCAERQQEILQHIWPALRPGGLLIYSTCTYNTEENEEMIALLHRKFGAEVLPVQTPSEWGIQGALQGDLPVYRFMPHHTRGEGFFMAVLRKPEETADEIVPDEKQRPKKKAGKTASPSVPVAVQSWIKNPETFCFPSSPERATAFPLAYQADLARLTSRLNVIHAGIPLCTFKGKDAIPEPALALSTAFNREAFPSIDADLPTVLSYLKREAIQLPDSCPKGYIPVTYRNIPLGWVKNIGNRANNLYPQEWRIRSGYLPEKSAELPWILPETK